MTAISTSSDNSSGLKNEGNEGSDNVNKQQLAREYRKRQSNLPSESEFETNEDAENESGAPVIAAEDGGEFEEKNKALENTVQELDKKKQQRYKRIANLAKAADLGMMAMGRGGSKGAQFSNALGRTAEGMSMGQSMGGALRGVGSNIAANKYQKHLQNKRNNSIAKSNFKAGLLAQFLRGDSSLTDKLKSGVTWAIMGVIFKALWSVLLFIPALLYLNIHNFLNKIGFRKAFGDFLLVQKLQFYLANCICGCALLILVVFIIIMVKFIKISI
jgi:hypothetical protein